MFRKLLITALAMSGTARAQDRADCFDTAVVARIIEYQDSPMPDLGPDVIVMRWPHKLLVDVERSIAGEHLEGHQTITMVLHAPLIERRHLFYLRRWPDGGYSVVSTDPAPEVDVSGKLAFRREPPFSPLPVDEHVAVIAEDLGGLCPLR